ncbi:Transmembrane protein, partial [Globisporangium splendens]
MKQSSRSPDPSSDADDDQGECWKQSDATVIMEEAPDSARDGSDWVPISSVQSSPAIPPLTPVRSMNEDLPDSMSSKLAKETATAMPHKRRIQYLLPGANCGRGDSEQSRRSSFVSSTSFIRRSSTAQDAEADDVHVSVLNRKHIGMLVSVAVASMLVTWLKRGVLPLMQRRFEMESTQVDSAELLLLLPWSCSFVLGFVSDIFPIFGSHRKAYMMIGWVLSALSLFLMSVLNHSKKYDASMDDAQKTAVIGGYVFLLGVACFGGILSIMMAEIYVIALSKRESLLRRGHVVGTFLLVQFAFQGIGQVIVDSAIFHISATGDIKPLFSFQDVISFLVAYSLVPIPILFCFFSDHLEEEDTHNTDFAATSCADFDEDVTFFAIGAKDDRRLPSDCGLLQEKQPPPSNKLVAVGRKTKHHWKLLWTALEEKATWQIVCFLCVFIFFSEFTLRYPFLVLDQWSGVTPKMISRGKIFTELWFFLAAFIWKGVCVNTQWGTFVVLSYMGVFIFPPMTYYLLMTFRHHSLNLNLYMLVSSSQGFIRAMAVVLEVAMMIELAPRSGEGATLGTVVSIATIMRLVSQTFSNLIGYLFGTQLLTDRGAKSINSSASASSDEPLLVATALILCYTIRLFALLGVVFLPSQKRALMRLHADGGRRGFRAWWTLGILAVALLVGTIVNSLVITPQTTCLHILGGAGCDASASTTGTSIDS